MPCAHATPTRRVRRRTRGAILALCLLGLGAPTPGATEGAIDLDADRAEIDNAAGVSVYTGDVVLTRGDRRVTGDRMTVHLSGERTDGEARRLERVVIEGQPAVFRQRASAERAPVRARAPRMEYHAFGPERITLTGGARLEQGRSTFEGERIHYDLEAERVEASGEQERGERVRIRLFPDDAEEEQEEQPD